MKLDVKKYDIRCEKVDSWILLPIMSSSFVSKSP